MRRAFVKPTYSCTSINKYIFSFAGIATVSPCCYFFDFRPKMGIGETGKETVESFIRMWDQLVLEGGTLPKEQSACAKCPNYQLDKWIHPKTLGRVDLGFYPSPCNAKCFYCDIHNWDQSIITRPDMMENYEKTFAALEYAKTSGFIAPDTLFAIDCGEITVHPNRERIFDIVGTHKTNFLTNCFIFNKRIGANLAANPNSKIRCSIDSGTAETWRKVKGVDNFQKAVDTLV